MDWDIAITRNRGALLRLLMALFAAAGIAPGARVACLPRRVRSIVLDLLRPVEAATLRLIVMAARGLVVIAKPIVPFPSQGIPRGAGARERAPSFPLADRRKRFGASKPRTVPGPGPRIFFFDGNDPVIEVKAPVSPDDAVDAARLCRRLLALKAALETLPRQARRFARWQARSAQKPPRDRRSPLRPGRPPGYRKRPRRGIGQEMGEILSDCDELARRALEPPI